MRPKRYVGNNTAQSALWWRGSRDPKKTREYGTFRVVAAGVLISKHYQRVYGAFPVTQSRWAGILTLPRENGAFRVAVAGILSTGEGAEREIAVGAAVLALSKVKCHVKCLKVSAKILFLS
jgi:hypothetical protein